MIKAAVVGHVAVAVKIRGRRETLLREVLVDARASFTVLPLDLAEEFLLETPFEVELKLGDGRRVKARVFIGEVEIEGRRGPVRILAFENAVLVVGVDTLETLGLGVDPTTGRLEKTEFYMLYI